MSVKTVVIAAGGSGGHIYPALAIANRLKKERPEVLIFFVGTSHGLENRIIPQAGYPLLHIPIGRLNSNVKTTERIKTVLQMPLAFLKALWILLKLRPTFLLGVGGHASGPMLLMGALSGFTTFIWEPNAFPGMANRYLSRFVRRIFVVFDKTSERLGAEKSVKLGYPMREQIESMQGQENKLTDSDQFHILVFGGSQGAQSINTAILQMVEKYSAQLQDVKILLQTGKTDLNRVQTWIAEKSIEPSLLEVTEYIHDMENKYQWADALISRSGMGSVTEIAAVGKACIFIPLASSSDGHQQKNAEALVEKNAARMILQTNLNADSLYQQLLEIKNQPHLRQQMAKALSQFYLPQGAEKIVAEILSEVKI